MFQSIKTLIKSDEIDYYLNKILLVSVYGKYKYVKDGQQRRQVCIGRRVRGGLIGDNKKCASSSSRKLEAVMSTPCFGK